MSGDAYRLHLRWTRFAIAQVAIAVAILVASVVKMPSVKPPTARLWLLLPVVASAFWLAREGFVHIRRRPLLEVDSTRVTVWPPYFGRGKSLAWQEISQVSVVMRRVRGARNAELPILVFTPLNGSSGLELPLSLVPQVTREELAEQISHRSPVPVAIAADRAQPGGS